jgi:hypothetical protein
MACSSKIGHRPINGRSGHVVHGGPVQTPAQLPILSPAGGANQIRVRAYNERLVLSLVRLYGSQSKADIARRTGLSAQTVSVIMRALEKEGLLSRGEPVRGRVGQPSIPMRLNPDAVYSFGVKMGRRSADLVLMDFVGRIRMQKHADLRLSAAGRIPGLHHLGHPNWKAGSTPKQRGRIAGVGLAAPFELWNWEEEVGSPKGAMDVWRDVDLQTEVAARVSYPVFLQNDATSACGAELVFGVGPSYPDFVYFFIGSFIGGGIVLNSAIFSGRTGTLAPSARCRSAARTARRCSCWRSPRSSCSKTCCASAASTRSRCGIPPTTGSISASRWNLDPGHRKSAGAGDRCRRLDHRLQRRRHRRRLSRLGARTAGQGDDRRGRQARSARRRHARHHRRGGRRAGARHRRRQPADLRALPHRSERTFQGGREC